MIPTSIQTQGPIQDYRKWRDLSTQLKQFLLFHCLVEICLMNCLPFFSFLLKKHMGFYSRMKSLPQPQFFHPPDWHYPPHCELVISINNSNHITFFSAAWTDSANNSLCWWQPMTWTAAAAASNDYNSTCQWQPMPTTVITNIIQWQQQPMMWAAAATTTDNDYNSTHQW